MTQEPRRLSRQFPPTKQDLIIAAVLVVICAVATVALTMINVNDNFELFVIVVGIMMGTGINAVVRILGMFGMFIGFGVVAALMTLVAYV